MSSAEAFRAAMAELKQEQAAAIAVHRADSKALMDMAAKLDAALQGQITDVDVAALAAEIHQAAVDLHSGIADTHTGASEVKTVNQDQSHVQGGDTAGPDVVSASSPGTIVPPASGTEASNAVPETLGGGAMPAQNPTIIEKEPGAPVPSADGEEKPAEPQPSKAVAEPTVPSVEDVPSNIHDGAPDSAKKD